jgi:hypothetical protein
MRRRASFTRKAAQYQRAARQHKEKQRRHEQKNGERDKRGEYKSLHAGLAGALIFLMEVVSPPAILG